MTATTDPIPAGNYTITIRLLDANGAQLNDDVTRTVSLAANQTLDLGNFQFTFTN